MYNAFRYLYGLVRNDQAERQPPVPVELSSEENVPDVIYDRRIGETTTPDRSPRQNGQLSSSSSISPNSPLPSSVPHLIPDQSSSLPQTSAQTSNPLLHPPLLPPSHLDPHQPPVPIELSSEENVPDVIYDRRSGETTTTGRSPRQNGQLSSSSSISPNSPLPPSVPHLIPDQSSSLPQTSAQTSNPRLHPPILPPSHLNLHQPPVPVELSSEKNVPDVINDRRSGETTTPDRSPRQNGQLSSTSSISPNSPLPSSVPHLIPDQSSSLPQTFARTQIPLLHLPILPPSHLDLHQPLLEEDEMEKLVRDALDSVADGSFDEYSARKFTKEMKPILSAHHSRQGDNSEVERFSHLICARLNKLFVLERCRHVLHGLHFFYTALLLTGDVVMWMTTDPEKGEILILVDHQSIELFLWKKIFSKTQFTAFRYQEILNLLSELGNMVKMTHSENPSVCYHLANNLYTAYLRMRVGEKTFLDNTKDLILIMAKCAWAKERYDIAGQMARDASEEYFECGNGEAWELWAKCCHKQGDLKLAVQGAELAVSCSSRRRDRLRLQMYLTSLRNEISQPTKTNSEVNLEWIEGNAVLHNLLQPQQEKAKKIQEHHKRKKSRCKTKAVPKTRQLPQVVNNENWLTEKKGPYDSSRTIRVQGTNGTEGKDNVLGRGIRPIPAFRRNEEVMIDVDPWENDSEGSKESDLSDSEDSAEEYNFADEEEEPGVDDSEEDIPTKTWFEESQDLYKDGKEQDRLIVGEGLDIVFHPKSRGNRRVPIYPPFRVLYELDMLLKTQPEKYKRCRIEIDGPHKAICKVLDPGETTHRIEIHGRRKCGQTYNNDEVVVEIIDPNRPQREDADKVFGKVVGVLSSKFSETEFPLLACTNNPKEVDVMHPMCKSVPKLYVWNGRTKYNYKNHKYRIDVYKIGTNGKLQYDKYVDIVPNKRGQYVFLVVFLNWNSCSTYPRGAVLNVLDCGSSFSSGLQVLQNQFKVPTYYSKDTVAHVADLLQKNRKRSPKGYIDLTEHTVFTIDPPQSKDLDDALSIGKEGENFIVGVHIADVASVVKKGDAVDLEAQKRATSFYPAPNWRTHNMFPEPLSQNLLSLLPNEERLVLSVFFLIDGAGETIREPLVKKCVIKSCRQFSYKEAQLIIDGRRDEVECSQLLKESILQLHALAQLIRAKRLKNSRFAVQFDDPRFLDIENVMEAEDSHALVEEFMIKANHSIASWLISADRTCVPLRCQAAPLQEELDLWIDEEGDIIDMLTQLQGKTLQNKTIQATKHCTNNNDQRTAYIPVQKNIWRKILEAANKGNLDALQKLLCCDELHPLQCLARSHWLNILHSAVYKCSADGTDHDLKHFMLDIEPYTHFTSPIRRYIDIVVHRLVHAQLDGAQSPYTSEEVQDICMHVTEASKRQRQFDRGCRSIRKAEKLAKMPMVFDAVVDTVSTSRATLCIPSLQNVSNRNRDIPFNLLDFCCKPEEMRNDISDKTEVVGSWNKRIYRFEDLQTRRERDIRQSDQRQRDPLEARIKSTMHVVHVQLRDFSKLLKAVFERSNEVTQITTNLNLKGERCYLSDHTGGKNVTSEVCGDSQIYHHSKFNLTFTPGQVLRVQMHAAADQGILSPRVQLFQVCDNLNLCLTHVHDPVNTYAKYVTKSIRNQTFKTVADYQQTWLPIVEMDSVTTSVSSEQTVLVYGVKVQLHVKDKVVLGSFSFDIQFCEVCKIEIDGKTIDQLHKMESGESPYDKCQARRLLDYLCIRYTPQEYHQGGGTFQNSSVWVGHAVIKKVKKRVTSKYDDEDGQVIITFQLTSNSIPPPTSLLTRDFTALVEIIFKSEVDRRTQKMLLTLDEDEDTLAKSIALNSAISPPGEARLQMCRRSQPDVDQGLLLKKLGYMPPNNTSQREAIKKALVQRFSLIQGPPGTGKTYTGLKLVYLFNKINKSMHRTGYDTEQKQVLFCGPSNKSVDLVAKYLLLKLGQLCPKIVRMYGKTIENKDFPVPKRDIISNRSLRGLKSDPELRKVTLHHVIREEGKPYAKRIAVYDAMFDKYFRSQNTMQIDLSDIKAYTRLIAKAQKEELKICDVILCTCAASGNRKMTRVTRISQCIIDESAMCPEPQSMIPIIATNPDQVVLIGDHKQLRPIVQCTRAAELGLDQSLFERYKEGRSFLNTQYRMHPKICEFPSKMFYEEKLKTGPDRREDAKWYIPPGSELSIWPVSTKPKVFCHVEGVEETLTVSTEDGNEQSKSNMQEVEKIVDSFLYLVKTNEIPAKNINLMTQYNAQRNAIKERLTSLGYFDDVTTQTVVASQGGEWDYVIFSTVRSLPNYKIEANATPGWLKHNLGFITDQHQINVALTRSRKGLIIIGNANLLNCDPVWRQLLTLYTQEDCYVNADEFPPPLPAKSGGNRGIPLKAGNPGVLPNRI